ncbi:MAG: hypothetical protein M0R73_08980 [Dehalococcoidia bacterium]|nr:hypothetical protein [Dehalococcoidia bacterium]
MTDTATEQTFVPQPPQSIEAATAAVEERDGLLVGPVKAPVNLGAGLGAGSIHDDKTAQKLGFSGGTVAGSVHMQQFPPMLVRVFGPEWFERGGLSCYFQNATTHGVPVRPFGRPPQHEADAPPTDAQMEIWAEREDGARVLEGTASIGAPDEPSVLAERLRNLPPRGEVRILGHIEPGLTTDAYPTRLEAERYARTIDAMTEPLGWYADASPWGGPIINPGAAVGILRACEPGFDLRRHKSVGLFGGIEINHLAGPMFVGRDYESRGEVLAVGETPRSEYIWYRTRLSDGGTDVAEMVMMLRFMKGSSDLWE